MLVDLAKSQEKLDLGEGVVNRSHALFEDRRESRRVTGQRVDAVEILEAVNVQRGNRENVSVGFLRLLEVLEFLLKDARQALTNQLLNLATHLLREDVRVGIRDVFPAVLHEGGEALEFLQHAPIGRGLTERPNVSRERCTWNSEPLFLQLRDPVVLLEPFSGVHLVGENGLVHSAEIVVLTDRVVVRLEQRSDSELMLPGVEECLESRDGAFVPRLIREDLPVGRNRPSDVTKSVLLNLRQSEPSARATIGRDRRQAAED